MAEKQEPKRVKFKLSQPHTHAGEDKNPGDIIEIREDQAKRLKQQGRGDLA
jgi:hypothetical protein